MSVIISATVCVIQKISIFSKTYEVTLFKHINIMWSILEYKEQELYDFLYVIVAINNFVYILADQRASLIMTSQLLYNLIAPSELISENWWKGKQGVLISPSATYMRQWPGSALVQVMTCRLFGAKPLPEPLLIYCPLNP